MNYNHYDNQYESQSGFQEFFSQPAGAELSESQFIDIGLPLEVWESDPEWQELAAMGIGPIEAVQLVSPDYAETDFETMTEMLREQAWEMSAAEQAEFWKSIKRAARGVARVASRVVKPLARVGGTALGTFLGGPIGAKIGSRVGSALGGLASRGLRQVSRPGGARRVRNRVRRNVNTARTRVRRGQPVFTNRQVTGAMSQLRSLLGNPQIAALLGRRESHYADSYGAEAVDDLIYETVGEILEIADHLEAALDADSYAETAGYQEQFAEYGHNQGYGG